MTPPNIVIIVWDAVRAENLPFYGYHRNTTPGLQSMDRDFAVYQNAISSSYWTLPSMTSLFTGMYPSGHGLLVDGDRIAPEIQLLTDILGRQGYQCGAFNRNPYVSDFTGLDRGFDHYVSDAGCLWDYLKRIERKLKKRFSTDPSFAPELETTDQKKRQCESKETLDAFCADMIEIAELSKTDPDALHHAPVTTPVGRLDEVAAAKNMDLVYET